MDWRPTALSPSYKCRTKAGDDHRQQQHPERGSNRRPNSGASLVHSRPSSSHVNMEEFSVEMLEWVRRKHWAEKLNKMHKVVKYVQETNRFYDDTSKYREQDAEEQKDLPPVFNKRLFASQGAVVLTGEARRLMARNELVKPGTEPPPLTRGELQALRCVVEGLKLIHKTQDYVKDVLSHVITLESYDALEYVVAKPWEDAMSCYFIVHGAVEVTYDMRVSESRNVYQPNIIYSHSTGEYLGLVSAEGRSEDLAPPATAFTKEPTEFIRIDREKFHGLIDKIKTTLDVQKRDFLYRGRSFIRMIPDDAKEKIMRNLSMQDYSPNKILLNQDETSEYLFILVSGRCQCYREVYVPEADRDVLFYLCCREQDDFFGEECVLDDAPSYSTIVATSRVVCFKLHRSALEIVHKESLYNIIADYRHEFPREEELRDRGYRNSLWNNYKHGRIKTSLKEGGKLKYLTVREQKQVIERPPTGQQQYRENMYRFLIKGAQFVPLRAQSAHVHATERNRLPPRPKTAFPDRRQEDVEESDSETETEPDSIEVEQTGSKLMSADLAKLLEKHYSKTHKDRIAKQFLKNLGSDEIAKLMEENTEVSNYLKKAWEVPDRQPQGDKDGFMKNGVLVTMKTDDIVRKAKALADQYATKVNKRGKKTEEEEWNTILHAENKQAKLLIATSQYRVNLLRKKMEEMEKKRTKAALRKHETALSRETENENTERHQTTLRLANGYTTEESDRLDGSTHSLETTENEGDVVFFKRAHGVRAISARDPEEKPRTAKRKSSLVETPRSETSKSRPQRPNSAIVTRREAENYNSNRRVSRGKVLFSFPKGAKDEKV